MRILGDGLERVAMEVAGVTIVPDNTLPHIRRFYTHDPFGNRLEFMEKT